MLRPVSIFKLSSVCVHIVEIFALFVKILTKSQHKLIFAKIFVIFPSDFLPKANGAFCINQSENENFRFNTKISGYLHVLLDSFRKIIRWGCILQLSLVPVPIFCK
jgi:hypothetical protein